MCIVRPRPIAIDLAKNELQDYNLHVTRGRLSVENSKFAFFFLAILQWLK